MNYLISNVTLLHPLSNKNNTLVSVSINEGVVRIVEPGAQIKNVEIIDGKGLYISPSFCDIYTTVGDPGFEYREDINSIAKAALNGGYTMICTTANNSPISQTKSQVEYLINNSQNTPIDILPIGAITENFDGKTPTEMLDMHNAGAIAFADIPHSIKDAGVFLRALQYVQPFNGLIISFPYDKTLVGDGQINESVVSVKMGMKGISNVSEYSIVQRDIELLKYTGGKIHFVGISTKESIALIRQAKKDGLNCTCSVFVHHLISTEKDVQNFDSKYKVFPPLRTQEDQSILLDALQDGTIDCISTQHTPLSIDEKDIEFEMANFGIIGLETALGLLYKKLENSISKERLIELISINPRKILGKEASLEDSFVLINFNKEYQLEEKDIHSKSKNTPYLNTPLKGAVVAVFSKKEFHKL